jgi:sugar fermentation stimulation protein A
MKYTRALEAGIFQKRYKRFFADVQLQDQIVVAHVPNTGSLKSVNNPGQPCLISHSDNPERKLKFTLEMIQSPTGAWVGVNTATPNAITKEKLLEVVGKKSFASSPVFGFWSKFDEVKPEYKITPETRLDFALKKAKSEKMHYIEVKNVTLAEAKTALFPDSVSERAQKHVRELMRLMNEGHSAEIVFTVQRSDCELFAPADDIDPEYGRLLRQASALGLKLTPLVVELNSKEVLLTDQVLPVHL